MKKENIHENSDEDLLKDIKEKTYDKLYKIAEEGISNKKKRGEKFKEVREEYLSSIKEDEEFDEFLFGKYFHDIEKEAIRNSVLDKKIRLDEENLMKLDLYGLRLIIYLMPMDHLFLREVRHNPSQQLH